MPRRSRLSGRPSTTSPRTSKSQKSLRELIDELPAERAAAVFTHSSWAADRIASYERLEFLGDSVLELVIARTLYDRFPEFTEGRMAKVRSHVVSRASCAVVSRELELGERLRGEGSDDADKLSRNRNVLAALLEAALAALYLEHGFEAIEPAIVGAFDPRIEYALTTFVDHKTELQERLARSGRGVTYATVKVEGPPHDRSFTAAAIIDAEVVGIGKGRSKKDAEQDAARGALEGVNPEGVDAPAQAAATFDPEAYKETTRIQWQDAAKAWHRWDPVFDRWLDEATQQMLDLAHVGEGTRVLDIAAGSGGQSVEAARRGAVVLATDLSSNILDEAAAAARAAGVANLTTRVMDGEALDVDPGSFDAAISRLGLMSLPDKLRGLAAAKDALRPGGRYAVIVFSEPDRNRFLSVPISIIQRNAKLPPPEPGLPGVFSATNLAELLEGAGFQDVEVHRVTSPLRLSTAAECAQLERESFGALHQMLAGLDEAARAATWAEIEGALREFEGPGGFAGPCELLVGAGTK